MTKHIAGFILFTFIVGTTVVANVAINTVSNAFAKPAPVKVSESYKVKKKKRKKRRCGKKRRHHYEFDTRIEKKRVKDAGAL